MIDFLIFYGIFCVSTAVVCLLYFWLPVLRWARNEGAETPVVMDSKLSSLVYFCLTLVAAPIMFFVLFSPTMSANYMEGLRKIAEETDE